jgi:putative pyrroloquinoline-quinone binding quinoprotein/putative pyrroloquinoline-quinone-binding quinoprotein
MSNGIRALRQRGLSLALLLGSVNAGCINMRPPPAPVTGTVAGDAPTQVWTSRAGRRLSSPLVSRDNSLYAGGIDRKVYAVDLNSGEIRWTKRLSGMLLGGVLVAGDTLFAGTSRPAGRVYALQRSDGKELWHTDTGPIGAPLAVIDRVLVAANQRGEVLGLELGTGKIRWRRKVGVSRVAPVPAGDGGVLVATIDSLVRLSVTDGKVTHRAGSPGTVVSPWIPFAGNLVAGTTDSQVVSIDPRVVRHNWSVRVDAPVFDSPAAMGDTLFLATRMGSLYRIVPGSEPSARRLVRLEWPVTTPVTIVNREIILGGADGTIRALRTDGHEVWRVRIWRPVELSPVPIPDGLVAIGGNGDLHRYRNTSRTASTIQ